VAAAIEAVVKRAIYISEMSQTFDIHIVQYCFTAIDEEGGPAVRLMFCSIE
jgi:hypothetical protein